MTHFSTVWAAADAWQREALVALAVAAVVQIAFVFEFALRPWFRDPVGRAIMLKSSTLLMLLMLSLVNTFFRYPGQQIVSSVGVNLLLLAIAYQFSVLVRSPRGYIAYPEISNGDTPDDDPLLDEDAPAR